MNAVATTVRKDVKDFFTLTPQVKFLLVIQLIVLFILSILIGIVFSPKFKESVLHQSVPGVTPDDAAEKAVRLALLPQTKFMKPGEEATFYVTISGDPAYAVDTVLKYDPLSLSVSSVENGDVFDRVVLNEVKSGTITFSAVYDPGKAAFKKEGIVLKFKAKALKKTEETIIHFDMKQTIAAQDGKNILKTAEPATLHIFD